MNFAKIHFLSFVVFSLSFGAATPSLFAADDCSKKDLEALLQIAEELRTSVKQPLEAAREIGEWVSKVIKIEAKLVQLETAPTSAFKISEMPSTQTKKLSNGAEFHLVHGKIDDVASQVWRDGDILWAPVTKAEEFAEYARKNPLTYDELNGPRYLDYQAMAKAYCEALMIPGLQGVKWILPDIDIFLKAAGNTAPGAPQNKNRLLLEAFPEMSRRWFWSSSEGGSGYARVFGGSYGSVDYGLRGYLDSSVRCVSRGAGR